MFKCFFQGGSTRQWVDDELKNNNRHALAIPLSKSEIELYFTTLDEVSKHVVGMQTVLPEIERGLFRAHIEGDLQLAAKTIRSATSSTSYGWAEFDSWWEVFKGTFKREPMREKYFAEQLVGVIHRRAFLRHRLAQIRDPDLRAKYIVLSTNRVNESNYTAHIIKSLGWPEFMAVDDARLTVDVLPIHPEMNLVVSPITQRHLNESPGLLAQINLSS